MYASIRVRACVCVFVCECVVVYACLYSYICVYIFLIRLMCQEYFFYLSTNLSIASNK